MFDNGEACFTFDPCSTTPQFICNRFGHYLAQPLIEGRNTSQWYWLPPEETEPIPLTTEELDFLNEQAINWWGVRWKQSRNRLWFLAKFVPCREANFGFR